MALTPLPSKLLSSANKDKLETLTKNLTKLEWEKGEYYFHNFVEYYQLPQIVRAEQPWQSGLATGQCLYLQTLFDRYLIVAAPISSKSSSSKSKQKYLIPDWFQGECKMLSKNPVLKRRWWVFQGAFELYRFDLPRAIKVLADTPAHVRPKSASSKTEWDKIVLRKNARLSVVRREKYQSRVKNEKGELMVSEPKEAFVLSDQAGNEFIVPPGVPLRFATLIEQNELHAQYYNHEGTFTFPEIMMRYEFPLDVEITTHLPVDLPHFKAQLRLETFCVAKSVIGYVLAKGTDEIQVAELSPLTQFTLHCAKCLTYGLPREGSENTDAKEEKFDEKEYQRYEDVRSQMNAIFDDATELHKSKILAGSAEEVDCIETAYSISMNMKEEEDKPLSNSYSTLEDAIVAAKKELNKDEIPFPKSHPKRFTVHASADPTNPYNEVIDYEEMDALNQSAEETAKKTTKTAASAASASSSTETPAGASTSGLAKSSSMDKRSSSASKKREKPQQPSNQTGSRAALVVQQLPPPMLLPPESFEKTLKAIPEKLYTDFIPATVTSAKKSDSKTGSASKTDEKPPKRDKPPKARK